MSTPPGWRHQFALPPGWRPSFALPPGWRPLLALPPGWRPLLALPPGWRHRHYDSVTSTSDICVALATAGEPAGLAITADRQTAARGSRGREWTTLPGNLALSVLLRPTGPAADAGQWSLLAAVAVHAALAGSGVVLKWPNDLMVDGRKLGGILIDSGVTPQGGIAWLVMGIGLNLAAAPDGAAVLPRDAATVAPAILGQLDEWNRVRLIDGFGPIRRAWMDRGPAHGQPMQVGTVAGTYDGLDDRGALLLHTGSRVDAFSTGDVVMAAP